MRCAVTTSAKTVKRNKKKRNVQKRIRKKDEEKMSGKSDLRICSAAYLIRRARSAVPRYIAATTNENHLQYTCMYIYIYIYICKKALLYNISKIIYNDNIYVNKIIIIIK